MKRAWDTIEGIFKELGYPYLRQGSLASAKDYPETFYTFWNVTNAPRMDYDDNAHMIQSVWSICSYTCKPELMYSLLDGFILKCKEIGVIIGEVQDTDSDRPDYYGRNVSITILVKEI